jgi:SAM-dependent methyltransferase
VVSGLCGRRRHVALALLSALALAFPAAGGAPDSGHAGSGHATVKHRFPGVEKARAMYDAPGRDEWQKPEALVKALRLSPGDRVADLGAGTGYFERHLAAAVGERGQVFAVEVEPALVGAIRARAEKEKTANVTPVLGSFDNPRLGRDSLDLVLIVDTYHHIDDRRGYFERLRGTLRDGGRVAIVDFEKRPLPVGPGVDHKLDKPVVIAEMTAAGYRLDQDLDELLPYQYLLVFSPADSSPTPATARPSP